MYFGYGQVWMFTFVPLGFVIVMSTMIGYGFIYAVGASRGASAAALYLRRVTYGFLGFSVLNVGWALVNGQLLRFLGAYGVAPLAEMVILALLGIGSLWFMAVSYVNSKSDEGA